MAENNDNAGWENDVASAGADLAAAAVQPVSFGQLGAGSKGADNKNLDLLLDVEIPISVEVGRAEMSLEDVLKLVPGSIIALDKKSEEPVDLRVNGKLVARGEVVLVDDTYGLRITQIVDAAGRIESLR
ncbi:MAG: flagellar motor switch protein FliN [Planctomycetota bacterium]